MNSHQRYELAKKVGGWENLRRLCAEGDRLGPHKKLCYDPGDDRYYYVRTPAPPPPLSVAKPKLPSTWRRRWAALASFITVMSA